MKNKKLLSGICILIGIFFIASLTFINSFTIELLYGSTLQDYYLDNIKSVQKYLLIFGITYLIIGLVGIYSDFLDIFNRKNKLINPTLLLVFVVAAILFTEALLRIKPEFTTGELYDYSIPYENALFSKGILPQETRNIPYGYNTEKFQYRLNQGYHGETFEYAKPKDEIRIIIQGGSFIFGDHHSTTWKEINEEYNKNWISRIEAKLHDYGLKNVRIINAGIPSYASFDSFGILYSELHMYQPDYVILCHGWNDLKYFPDISPSNSLLRAIKPHYVKTREEIDDPLEISQIYLRVKRLFQFGNVGLEGQWNDYGKYSKSSPHAIKQFELNVHLFVQACKWIGAQPILLTQPRLISENNTEDQLKRIDFRYQRLDHKGINTGFSIIDSVIMNYNRIDSSVLNYDFAEKFVGIDSLYMDHIHLSKVGSEVLSSDLANYLIGVLDINIAK